MGSQDDKTPRLPQAVLSLFAACVEESLSLRLIVLAMGWWVAVSLGWSGSPVWVWAGGAVLLSAGQAFSWYFRRSGSRVRSGVIALAVVGSMALLLRAVGPALHGDWFPVAHVLILFQGIISFEQRSRGGLYANIAIGGVILFFVAQRAPDLAFGIFLTVFTTLFLSFLAMSFLLDQARHAEVRWFRRRLSFASFWCAILTVSLTVSSGIFLVLPKGFGGNLSAAEAVVLPMRATESASPTGPVTQLEGLASALPLTASDIRPEADNMGPAERSSQKQMTAAQPQAVDDTRPDSTPIPRQEVADASPETQPEGDVAPSRESQQPKVTSRRSDGEGEGATDEGSVVMQVRSPVLTYWRGQVFDTFDGQSWHRDPSSWAVRSRGRNGTVYQAGEHAEADARPLYSQTFFLKQAAQPGSLFTGYSPLVATVPTARAGARSLADGTVYRVLSALPDFSAESLAARPRNTVGECLGV